MDDSEKLTIDEIYAELDAHQIDCKGLCVESCGQIALTEGEAARIKQRHNVRIGFNSTANRCTALANGRCTIHADRPLICRLFGIVGQMQCPFGCVPEQWMSKQRALALIDEMLIHHGPDFTAPAVKGAAEKKHR